jgi:hypothetical protein
MKIIKFVPKKKDENSEEKPLPETPAKIIDIDEYLPEFWDPPEYIAHYTCKSCKSEFSKNQKLAPEGLVECVSCNETSAEMTGPHIPREILTCPDCGSIIFALLPDGGAFCTNCTAVLYTSGSDKN